MKSFTKRIFSILCLICAILTGGVVVSKAQSELESRKTVKNILAEIVRGKSQGKSFTILTPNDLGKLSATDLAVFAGACDTATPITVGQNINGQLTNTDCRLDDGSYADFYSYYGSAGQNVTITMYSSSVDAYTGIANEDGTFVVEDDDSGGGTNALLTTTLPADGLYIILANSALPNQFGDYSLNFNAQCTYTLNPTGATIAPEGGTFSFAINTQSGCRWAAGVEVNTFVSTNSMGIGSGTVTYTATANGFSGTRTAMITAGGQRFTVTQPALNCTFSLSPSSVTVPATGITDSFTVNTQPGCFWIAQSNGYGISAQTYGTGTGIVNYMVTTNNGADRTLTVTAAGQTFTVFQPGLNCTFSVSPTTVNVSRFENYGSFNVITQSGCFWTASTSDFWITLDRSSGAGPGTVNYRIYANQYPTARNAVIAVFASDIIRINVTQSGMNARTKFDFDADGKADVSVFRPDNGTWYLNQSQNGFSGFQFGISTDRIVPADFDGDSRTDIAVYRGGVWYLQRSQFGFTAIRFGEANDIPQPADYDGDGKADIAVFRPSNGTWYLQQSTDGFAGVQFGQNGDKPVAADFDGDNKTDIAVYRGGVWYINRSTQGFTGVIFGEANDIPVPTDFDGDGKADIAVFRPSNGTWFLQQSAAGFAGIQFGQTGDVPVPADYDGDSKADIAVFRNGNWYLNRSTQGFAGIAFGISSDKPTPGAFTR